MISPPHTFDVARFALGGGLHRRNRAHTLDRLGRETEPRTSIIEATRLSLPWERRGFASVVWKHGNRVAGIASARQRSGPRSWEIAHLLLAPDEDNAGADLLSRLCQAVARKGGERVFIRLQNNDPLADVARRSGFVRCANELLYRGRRGTTFNSGSLGLRVKRAPDEYNLFRLFTASTPSATRSALGITFGQWSSSRERSRGRSREFVLERDGQLTGWVKTARRFGKVQLTLMIHPGDETNLAALMDHGLSYLNKTNTVYSLVPEYQVLLQRLLFQRGYQAVSEYVILVRSMVARARGEKSRQAVTVAST